MKLGEHLASARVIDEAALQAGLARASATGERLGAALIALGHASGDQVALALAAQHDVPAAKDRQLAAAPATLVAKVPADLARKLRAVVVGEGRDRELIVALADPLDAEAIDRLEKACGRVVVAAVASTARLDQAIERLYPDTLPRVPRASTPVPIAPAPDIATAAAAAAEALASAPEEEEEEEEPTRRKITIPPLDIPAPPPPIELEEAIEPPRMVELTAELPPEQPEPVVAAATPLELPLAAPPDPAPTAVVLDLPPTEGLELTATPAPARPIAAARITTGSIPGTRQLPRLAGGTSVTSAEPPSGGLGGAAIRYVLGFAIAAVTASVTYKHCTRDPSWAIPEDYHSTYLRASFALPGGSGWRGHDTLRMNRTEGTSWARLEGFYRGGTVDDPAEGVLVLRVHIPGSFPEEVDMEAFRTQIDSLSRRVVSSAQGLAVHDLECTTESRVRSEPAAKCRGPGTFHDRAMDIYMFYWEDTVDDVMAVIYIARGTLDDKLDGVQTFIRGITVE